MAAIERRPAAAGLIVLLLCLLGAALPGRAGTPVAQGTLTLGQPVSGAIQYNVTHSWRVTLAAAGPPDPKQLGKLIGQVMSKLKATGRPFDGKSVNEKVKTRLGGV